MSEKKYPRRWTQKNGSAIMRIAEVREPNGLSFNIGYDTNEPSGNPEFRFDSGAMKKSGWIETFDHHDAKPALATIENPAELIQAVRGLRDAVSELMKSREDIRELGQTWFNHFKPRDKYVFGTSRVASVRTFLKQLPKAILLDAIERAHQKKPVSGDYDDQTFRYFCGTCWGIIKKNTPDGTSI